MIGNGLEVKTHSLALPLYGPLGLGCPKKKLVQC